MTILNVSSVPLPAREPFRPWAGNYEQKPRLFNLKLPLRIKNRTNYFDLSKDRSYVSFQSPKTYNSRQSKIEGYETRLYYEYLWHSENDGQTFFYTLTYNDAHIPSFLGQPCFDYEDLRYLLNGAFKKMLLRKYGTNLRYFVGAELGDGKGERGMHNNPHYHILFFLRDAGDARYPYIKISPSDFRHLVRIYWQGFDEDTDGFKPYQDAKFGIAKEGENEGLVVDCRAVKYVAKYVCKDVALVSHERKICQKLTHQYMNDYKFSHQSYIDFLHGPLYMLFNTVLSYSDKTWKYSEKYILELLACHLPEKFSHHLFENEEYKVFTIDIIKGAIQFYNLWQDYYDFCESNIDVKVYEDIKNYRNRHTNKCRISQHVGDYGLQFIDDPLSPKIPVPSKKGIKLRPIGQFYYRKMFTEIYTDVNGSQNRILNAQGIEYKVANIEKSIDRLTFNTKAFLEHLRCSKALYDKMLVSDVNIDVSLSFEHFNEMLDNNLKEYSLYEICKRYAQFKLVYEDRYVSTSLDRDNGKPSFPDIDVISDYRRFLQPSVYTVSRSTSRLDVFLSRTPENVIPYFAHPYFLRFSCLFTVLDLVSDYFSISEDDRRQAEAEELARVKRFHNKLALKEYYSHFK